MEPWIWPIVFLKLSTSLSTSVWAWACPTLTQKNNLTRNPGRSFNSCMTTKAWIKSAYPRFWAWGRWYLLSHRNFQVKFPRYVITTLPVSSKLLNFRDESQAVGKASGSLSCDCHLSRFFNYSPLGYGITEDLNIVSHPQLCDIFCKGPKYRLPQKINWSVNYDLTHKGVLDCQTKQAEKNHVPQTVLDEWVNAALSKVKSKATKLS